MKTRTLAAAMAAMALTAAPTAMADPYLAGVNDRGEISGYHYYEIYFGLDPGVRCDSGPNEVLLNVSPQYLPLPSYHGTSGFSMYYCQINVYAPVGSGVFPTSFFFQSGGHTGILGGPQLSF